MYINCSQISDYQLIVHSWNVFTMHVVRIAIMVIVTEQKKHLQLPQPFIVIKDTTGQLYQLVFTQVPTNE